MYLLDDGRDPDKKKYMHSLNMINAVYIRSGCCPPRGPDSQGPGGRCLPWPPCLDCPALAALPLAALLERALAEP